MGGCTIIARVRKETLLGRLIMDMSRKLGAEFIGTFYNERA
jgi:hypothetical protein